MLIDGKKVSTEIKQELINRIDKTMIKPCLAVVQVGNDEASNIYIKGKEKACKEVGIYFKHIKLNEDIKEIEIINKIKELNNDEYVNGILVQLPLPERFNQNRIINIIDKHKDVDGLTLYNMVKLYKNTPYIIPCTPKGIMKLIEYYEIDLEGKNVTVVGKSELVGKPLSLLLLSKGATVTICHSKTTNLKYHTSNADILVVAVGKEKLITKDMVKKNAYVFDVGINRVDNKICGDTDFENIKEIVNITPVPGGVGPMTVAMLLENTVENFIKNKRS